MKDNDEISAGLIEGYAETAVSAIFPIYYVMVDCVNNKYRYLGSIICLYCSLRSMVTKPVDTIKLVDVYKRQVQSSQSAKVQSATTLKSESHE